MSACKHRYYFSKIGEGKSHCLITNELRKKKMTKIGSFPFLRGPACFRKLKRISESPKRHWISVSASFSFAVFDPKTKTNFEGEFMQSTYQTLEYGKNPILESFWAFLLSSLCGQAVIFL